MIVNIIITTLVSYLSKALEHILKMFGMGNNYKNSTNNSNNSPNNRNNSPNNPNNYFKTPSNPDRQRRENEKDEDITDNR